MLLESIAYQSISGKAAEDDLGRIKALGADGRPPAPEQMLRIPAHILRKAGLSGAKVLAMKDLAKKALEGIVPTLQEALKLTDEELIERLICVRGIGAWTVEMFLIFRLGRPDVLADPRSRGEKGMVGDLRQEAHAQAARVAEIR